jgi:hypothetical protein
MGDLPGHLSERLAGGLAEQFENAEGEEPPGDDSARRRDLLLEPADYFLWDGPRDVGAYGARLLAQAGLVTENKVICRQQTKPGYLLG